MMETTRVPLDQNTRPGGGTTRFHFLSLSHPMLRRSHAPMNVRVVIIVVVAAAVSTNDARGNPKRTRLSLYRAI